MGVNEYLELLNSIDEHSAAFRQSVDECTWQEFRVLDMVARQPTARLHELGMERSVYQQGIGRIAARLERKGLAKVVRNERDKRVRNLVLTPQGRKVRARCRQTIEYLIGKRAEAQRINAMPGHFTGH